MSGILDTSIFIGLEQGRAVGDHPKDALISVATRAELHLGVLMAQDNEIRAIRLRTMGEVQAGFVALPITSEVAGVFAEIVGPLLQRGRKLTVMDGFIAATALTYELPLYTQDRGFEVIPSLDVHIV